MFYDKLRVTVGGDAAGGFLVDIHDGENSTVYNPQGVGNTNEAVAAALKDHGSAFPKAPTENDYVPQESAYPAPAASEGDPAAEVTEQTDTASATDPVPAAEAAPQAEEGAAPAASEANSQSADAPQA